MALHSFLSWFQSKTDIKTHLLNITQFSQFIRRYGEDYRQKIYLSIMVNRATEPFTATNYTHLRILMPNGFPVTVTIFY